MNVIFVGRKSGRVKQFDLRHPVIMSAAVLLVLAIVGTAFSIGVSLGARHSGGNPIDQLGNWSAELLHQKAQIEDTKRVLQEKVNALAMRVGQMNANVIRLDALGKRLTRMANLDDGEFDFGHPPALGGAESGADGQPAQIPNLTAMVDDLQSQLSSREQQLGVLENLILTRELNKQVYPEGRPVQEGWISSYFGRRADPFTGYSAVHKGLDFAGPEGTRVTVRRGRAGHLRGRSRGLWPDGGNQPRQWVGHPLLPQRKTAGEAGRHGPQGPGCRIDGFDRPIDRAAPAF